MELWSLIAWISVAVVLLAILGCLARIAYIVYQYLAARKVRSCHIGDPVAEYRDACFEDRLAFLSWYQRSHRVRVSSRSTQTLHGGEDATSFDFNFETLSFCAAVIEWCGRLKVLFRSFCCGARLSMTLLGISGNVGFCGGSDWGGGPGQIAVKPTRRREDREGVTESADVAKIDIREGDSLFLIGDTTLLFIRSGDTPATRDFKSYKDRLFDYRHYLSSLPPYYFTLHLLSHNLRTVFGVLATFDAVSILSDQTLDIVNAVQNYFLNGGGYPVLGCLSLALFLAPALLHWLLNYLTGAASTSDLLLSLLGLNVPIFYFQSLLRGVRLPGFFWGAIFEGIIEAPLQALLNIYNLGIGLMAATWVSVASLGFSIFMVAKNLNKLDQYGSPVPWSTVVQARNFVERLVEVSFRLLWSATFLALMRPDVPLQESCPHALLALLTVEVVLCAALVCPATSHHMCGLRVLWIAMTVVARPPYFLREMRRLYPAVLVLRLLEAAAMASIAKLCGHRPPSPQELAMLALTAFAGVVCVVARLADGSASLRSGFDTLPEAPSMGNEAAQEVEAMVVESLEDDNLILLELLLASGANPNSNMELPWHSADDAQSMLKVPALIWAVEHGRVQAVRTLLRHSADVDAEAMKKEDRTDNDDCARYASVSKFEMHSALSVAASTGSLEMVSILLTGGAKADLELQWRSENRKVGGEITTEGGKKTAFDHATEAGHAEVAEALSAAAAAMRSAQALPPAAAEQQALID